ncbi:hypothetical protein C5B85_05930 [Pseudoclavibacter sp. AY1F1]|nr:hypothetical protein C5B85_05930 [Pseudoclavibacter sp. AY1F1]
MAWSWIASPQEDNEGVGIITSMSIPGVILLITTAAVSLAIFIAPHVVFFGPSWLFHQLVGSLALVAFTLIRRNLVATMFLHMLVNAPILIPTVLAKL